jgi:hypothetical protein
MIEQPPTVVVDLVDQPTPYRQRDVILSNWGAQFAYDNVTLIYGHDTGGVTGDYMRVHGVGPGPAIARKTAVRGHADQWAVWAHQINLGPGAKAGIWFHGEENAVVPNVMVIGDTLGVSNAVIQWNAQSAADGMFFRIFKDGRITAELTADGVLRVRKVEVIE